MKTHGLGLEVIRSRNYHITLTRVTVGAIVLMTLVMISMRFAFAATATPTLDQNIYVATDGTPTFDASSWDGVVNSPTQGTDGAAKNGVVRTQDTIVYAIEQSVNESAAQNVTTTVTLTAGQVWSGIPAACKTSDVTPVSTISTDKRTLVCNTGDHVRGSKLVIHATALVKTANNGDFVTASATTKADGAATTPVKTADNVLVTALFDIDLENIIAKDASGARVMRGNNGPANEDGVIVTNILTARLKKYSELPVNTNGVGSQAITYTVPTYGPALPAGWKIVDWNGAIPCEKASANINSAITCTQASTGSPVSISIPAIDYAAATSPETNLYKISVKIWIPASDINAMPGQSLSLATRALMNPVPLSDSGLQSGGTGAEYNTANNDDSVSVLFPNGQGCSSISFQGDNNQGCGGTKTGTFQTTAGTKVFPDAAKSSDVATKGSLGGITSYYSVSPQLGKRMVRCMKVDHRYFEYIRPAQFNEVYAGISSTAPAMFTSYRTADSRTVAYSTNLYSAGLGGTAVVTDLPTPVIEYSTAAIGATDTALQSAKCDDSTGSWSTTAPADLSQITMVRTVYQVPQTLSEYAMYASERYTYKMRDDISPAAGTKAPAYSHVAMTDATSGTVAYDASQTSVYGFDLNPAITDDTQANYAFNNYNVDHLNFVTGRMDIKKNLTTPQQLTPGAELSYTITPVILGNVSAVGPATFTIEDMIPLHANLPNVATYVAGSQTVSGSNGTYSSAPTVGACSSDAARTCLKWTLTGVTPNSPVTSLAYKLRVSDQLVNATGTNSFTNTATITSDSSTINTNSDADLVAAGIQTPSAVQSLNYQTGASYSIVKEIDQTEYEVNSPDSATNYPKFRLKVANSSPEDLTSGQIIDVLPYNGDKSHDNIRDNMFNTSVSTASLFTDTSTKSSPGLAAVPVVPAGSSIEYVVFDANNTNSHSVNIKSDPCHKNNLPAGFDPLSTPTHPCYLLRWDGGSGAGQLVGGGTTGTGVTPWSSSLPADLNTVVAFRVMLPTLKTGAVVQPITYSIKPTGNVQGDVYCNNFSSRVNEISLEVRSNTVCARVKSAGNLAATGDSRTVIGIAALLSVGLGVLSIGYLYYRKNVTTT